MARIDWSVWLGLGRVSNLPTVWTNTLVGVVLAGGSVTDPRFFLLLLALSACYIAGMFLNDVFDRKIDAKERPERPIPSGRISADAVIKAACALFALAVVLLWWIGYIFETGTNWRPALSGLFLIAAIVFYNVHHKNNPASPIVMGLCRMLVYLTAAFSISSSPPVAVYIVALLSVAYLIGLTYVAKQENLHEIGNIWPLGCLALPLLYGVYKTIGDPAVLLYLLLLAAWIVFACSYLWRKPQGYIPKTVVSLIAGITLLDALFIAASGEFAIALLCLPAFALTLLLQRWISGT